LNDQPVIFNLVRGEGGDPGLRLFPQPGLLLQLLPQLRAGVGEVLQRLIQLSLSSSLRLLELPIMPESSLHKLILQRSRGVLLSVQGFAVLQDKLLLFSCNPEEAINKTNPVDSGDARQTKKKVIPLSAES
jgi:hypothetical protein